MARQLRIEIIVIIFIYSSVVRWTKSKHNFTILQYYKFCESLLKLLLLLLPEISHTQHIHISIQIYLFLIKRKSSNKKYKN